MGNYCAPAVFLISYRDDCTSAIFWCLYWRDCLSMSCNVEIGFNPQHLL